MTEDEKLVKNLKLFIKLTLLMIPLTVVLGIIGGWVVYELAPAGEEIYGIALMLPGLGFLAISTTGLVILKKKLFKDKEEFKRAAALYDKSKGYEPKE